VTTIEQSFVLFFMIALVLVGGVVGFVVCVRTYGAFNQGSLTAIVDSDEDLRPHPRLRRPRH
jgi:hypothetical protein